jgi:hypothetical protein
VVGVNQDSMVYRKKIANAWSTTFGISTLATNDLQSVLKKHPSSIIPEQFLYRTNLSIGNIYNMWWSIHHIDLAHFSNKIYTCEL